MKKSFLLVGLLAAAGLVACGPKAPAAPEVPTEEGMVTFYFELNSASIELKDYESIWLTGGFHGWKTGYDALELERLEKTNVYYTMTTEEALDPEASQWNEYQLVIGYNELALQPDAASGLQWIDGRKSKECAEPGGLGNLSFTYNAGDKKVSLGSHTFENSLPTPAAPLQNYTLKVEFEEAVPDYGKVLIFGSFPGSGWVTPSGDRTDEENKTIIDNAEMTPNDDRTVFTKTYASMVAGDYDCKILVEYKTAVTSIAWNAVDQTKDNYNFSITTSDGDNYTLDILGEKATYTLADPSDSVPVTIVVHNIGGELTAAGIGIAGGFNGWTIDGNMCEFDEATGDYVYEMEAGGTIEFGVMANSNWSDKCVAADGSNIAVELNTEYLGYEITVNCDFSKFGLEEQHLPNEQIVVEYFTVA